MQHSWDNPRRRAVQKWSLILRIQSCMFCCATPADRLCACVTAVLCNASREDMPAPALRQGPDAARTRVLKRAFVYCVWLCGLGAVCSLRCVYVGRWRRKAVCEREIAGWGLSLRGGVGLFSGFCSECLGGSDMRCLQVRQGILLECGCAAQGKLFGEARTCMSFLEQRESGEQRASGGDSTLLHSAGGTVGLKLVTIIIIRS